MVYLPIALFIFGFLLLILEIFIPGLGVFGITGLLCIFIGIFLIEDNLAMAVLEMSIVVIALAIISPFILKFVKKRKSFQKLGLSQALTSDEGFVSRKKGLEMYVGKQGKALTNLRPSGTVVLNNDTRVDVVSRGDFIDQGSTVEVTGVDGTWLVVKLV